MDSAVIIQGPDKTVAARVFLSKVMLMLINDPEGSEAKTQCQKLDVILQAVQSTQENRRVAYLAEQDKIEREYAEKKEQSKIDTLINSAVAEALQKKQLEFDQKLATEVSKMQENFNSALRNATGAVNGKEEKEAAQSAQTTQGKSS